MKEFGANCMREERESKKKEGTELSIAFWNVAGVRNKDRDF